eukprot:TRINITY_DN63264_c0_g1_i1.p1 TRINITY_DN63264_c0_g1~~TRINITY_DN63264_c0_g1_i1.p1  ORF type:complete len:397 (-),score=43.14 TRINITY_DN63264_c0_g1_i1:206-1339(-)
MARCSDVTNLGSLPVDTARQVTEWLANQPPPVLHLISEALPALDVGRLELVGKHVRDGVRSGRPRLLSRRGMHPTWSLWRAHAAEVSLFYDGCVEPQSWQQGPNTTCEGNNWERGKGFDGASLLWLVGGTDWQGFQGVFREVSQVGMRPTWVTWRLIVSNPRWSGGFVAFSSGKRTWGLHPQMLAFSYRGDDAKSGKRSFVLETEAVQNGGRPHIVEMPQISAGRPYNVAMRLDWSLAKVSLYIDGVQRLTDVPFCGESQPIRYVALYNWRSKARTAISELMLGDVAFGGADGPAASATDSCVPLWAAPMTACRQQFASCTAAVSSTASSCGRRHIFAVLAVFIAVALHQLAPFAAARVEMAPMVSDTTERRDSVGS